MEFPDVHPHTGRISLAAYGLHPIRCRFCPAPIGFIATGATGTPMPLDWWENPDGNMRVIDVDGAHRALAVDQAELFPPDPDTRWMPHFENCPGADEARRR